MGQNLLKGILEMFKMTLVFLLLCFLNISESYSFNWKECKGVFFSGAGVGIFISSTSYISSIGKCSAIGMNIADRKKLYIAQNKSNIQHDIAKGEGEYLNAYANLSGCDQESSLIMARTFQRSYPSIFKEDSNNSAKEIYENMNAVMSSDTILSTKCIVL
ncbi:MAG: DUF3015 family protein [Bacteriovoracaceae bacterium]|nr:DUF3015 family protein [Bacteriovoracaceae bacterium]